jgi:lipopolysaccharide transport system ATP-binding protein
MSDVVITAENLSKRYLVGHRSAERERYTALRDVLAREARNFARKGLDFFRGRPIVQGDEVEEFWALRDVSFEVRRGEVLGIIGRNGAGKSTLLKILSRITEPDHGRAILRGRVASLLEVGTGFHPELTGRENIFLNGAILGMTRAEIKAKFDEIVEFAEVERFLDTPVKRYSSGMYVRLAFSVAAHLEPEILVVDEVLAVGDAEFQKKCLGKMQEVASNHGRTILFVSHNMAAVESMCSAAVLLAKGRCVAEGMTSTVIQEYIGDLKHISTTPLAERRDRSGTGECQFVSVALENGDGVNVSAFKCGAEAVLNLQINNLSTRRLRDLRLSVGIDNELNQRVVHLDSLVVGNDLSGLSPGYRSVRVVIPRLSLLPGRYQLTLHAMNNGNVTDWIQNATTFHVEAGDYFGTGHLPAQGQGIFALEHRFVLADVNLERLPNLRTEFERGLATGPSKE